jgi:hypothetical protein
MIVSLSGGVLPLYAWMFAPVAGVSGVRLTGPKVKDVQDAVQLMVQVPTYADSALSGLPEGAMLTLWRSVKVRDGIPNTVAVLPERTILPGKTVALVAPDTATVMLPLADTAVVATGKAKVVQSAVVHVIVTLLCS